MTPLLTVMSPDRIQIQGERSPDFVGINEAIEFME